MAPSDPNRWPGCAVSAGTCCPGLALAGSPPYGDAPLALAISFRRHDDVVVDAVMLRRSLRQYGHVWAHIEAIYAALVAHKQATGSFPTQLFLPRAALLDVGLRRTGRIAGFAEAALLLSTAEMQVHRVPWVPVCPPSPWVTNATPPPMCCTGSAWPLASFPRPEIGSALVRLRARSPPSGIRLAQLNVRFWFTVSTSMRWSLRRHAWRALGVEHGSAPSASQTAPHLTSGCEPADLPLPNGSRAPVTACDTGTEEPALPWLFTVVLNGKASNSRRIREEAQLVAALRTVVKLRNEAALRAAEAAAVGAARGDQRTGGSTRRVQAGGNGSVGLAAAAAADLLEFVAVDLEGMSLPEEVCGLGARVGGWGWVGWKA